MGMDKTGKYCKEHGGNCYEYDKSWLCDTCAIIGLNKCSCGGNARSFGASLFAVTGCERCDEYVCGLNVDTRKLWNEGVRGRVNLPPLEMRTDYNKYKKEEL